MGFRHVLHMYLYRLESIQLFGVIRMSGLSLSPLGREEKAGPSPGGKGSDAFRKTLEPLNGAPENAAAAKGVLWVL